MAVDWGTVGAITGAVATVSGGALWFGNKIFGFGKISQRLDTVENDTAEIKNALAKQHKDLTKRIDDAIILIAQGGLTKSSSPRQLSAAGTKVLHSAGIDTILEERLPEIVEKVQARNPVNAYQVQQYVFDVVRHFTIDHPELKNKLEQGAFNSGQILSVVLFLGSIYIRDKVLAKLGMKPDEIDE